MAVIISDTMHDCQMHWIASVCKITDTITDKISGTDQPAHYLLNANGNMIWTTSGEKSFVCEPASVVEGGEHIWPCIES